MAICISWKVRKNNMKLYLKELKKICFSVVYVIFLALLIFSWSNNFRGVTEEQIELANSNNDTSIFSDSILQKPEEGQDSYGTMPSENEEGIMVGAVDLLLMQYESNSYPTYPFGYYKEVVLSDEDQNRILEILMEITGLDEETLHNLPDNYFPSVNGNIFHPNANVSVGDNGEYILDNDQESDYLFESQVSYEQFKELMEEVDGILGGKSYFELNMLIQYYGNVEMTYEDAVAEYEQNVETDKVSTSFARLFCDYMGLIVGLYPVFIAVVLWLKDRKNKMNEFIYCKKISSFKLVFVRYLAILTAVLLPIILFSFESLIPLMEYSKNTGIVIDNFAFIKYILWWLLPTTMIVSAIGTFFTILSGLPIAIIIQIIWWFIDRRNVLVGENSLFTLIIRHNTLGNSSAISNNLETIWLNRGLLFGLAIILIILSSIIYSMKRKGKLNIEYKFTKLWYILKEKYLLIFKK